MVCEKASSLAPVVVEQFSPAGIANVGGQFDGTEYVGPGPPRTDPAYRGNAAPGGDEPKGFPEEVLL